MTNKSTQIGDKKVLLDLGFDSREIEIYLALLNNGPMLPQHLARATGVKRTTLYDIFPQLIAKNLIQEIRQGKRRLLRAVAPDRLFEDYKAKYQEIKEYIGGLASVYRMEGLKPDIQIYEGLEGLKYVFMDTLNQKDELLSIDRIANLNQDLLNWLVEYYVPHRIKNKISVRAIVTANPQAEFYMPTSQELRETRFVPEEKFPFRIDTMISGEKLYFTVGNKGGPLVGIIIRSKNIAQTQKALFNLAWEGAAKYQSKS